MHTAHIAVTSLLALVFVTSGLLKASGNQKGYFSTREVGIPDFIARLTGFLEAFAALALIIGMKYTFLQWPPLLFLWVDMAFLLFFFFRAAKAKLAFPYFFLLTLLSFALATI